MRKLIERIKSWRLETKVGIVVGCTALALVLVGALAPTESGSGWYQRLIAFMGKPTLTLSSGKVTPGSATSLPYSRYKIAVEGLVASDDWDTVDTGYVVDGYAMICELANTDSPITIKNGVNNIYTGSGSDYIWSGGILTFYYDSVTGNYTMSAGGGNQTLDGLTDVNIASVSTDQVLKYNGSNWINANGSVSAGAGVSFFMDDDAIIATGVNNDYPVNSLLQNPDVVTPEDVDTIACVSNIVTYGSYLYNTAIGGTSINSGVWKFNTYCSVSSIGGGRVSSITRALFHVVVESETVTTTGTGTSRTCTASGGTLYASGDANADKTLAGYVQTPQGLYQITAFTSSTEVTILVPATYTNETGVVTSTWKNKFQISTGAITAITPNYTLYETTSAQAEITIAITDKLGEMVFGTSNNTTTISFTHNGTTHYSNFMSPITVRHNDLKGLNGDSPYYHLGATEYGYLTTTQLPHEKGGLEADVSAYAGLIGITGGATFQKTIGIANDNIVEIDGSPNSGEIAVYTANGLDGMNESEFKAAFNLDNGWIAITTAPSCADDTDTHSAPFVFSSYDGSTTIDTGNFCRYTQDATTKYGIITAMNYANPDTSIEVYTGSTDTYAASTNAITNFYISKIQSPQGFPGVEEWTEELSDTNNAVTSTPTADTWSNPGSLKIYFPPGKWLVQTHAIGSYYDSGSAQMWTGNFTLSTDGSAPYTESNTDTTLRWSIYGTALQVPVDLPPTLVDATTSGATYYVLMKVVESNMDNLGLRGDIRETKIWAKCEYYR